MEHSAHPRIEAAATYVLTVDTPVEEVVSCPAFDEITSTPTWTLIGEGTDGVIVLDDAALCSTPLVGRTTVVLIGVCEWTDVTNGVAVSLLTISDDADPTIDPDLMLDGSACWNDVWRKKTMGFHYSATAHNFGGTGPHEDDNVIVGGALAYRFNDYEMPAGTTITYDVACDKSEAKVFLIEDASPFTSSPRGSTGAGDIQFGVYSSGGIVFTWTHGDSAEPADCAGGGSLFEGLSPTGTLTTATGTEVMSMNKDDIEYIDWSGTFPACGHTDVLLEVDMKWYITAVAAPGGAHNIGIANEGVAGGDGLAWAYPAQGW